MIDEPNRSCYGSALDRAGRPIHRGHFLWNHLAPPHGDTNRIGDSKEILWRAHAQPFAF